MTWEMGASIDIEKKGRMEGVKECEERREERRENEWGLLWARDNLTP